MASAWITSKILDLFESSKEREIASTLSSYLPKVDMSSL